MRAVAQAGLHERSRSTVQARCGMPAGYHPQLGLAASPGRCLAAPRAAPTRAARAAGTRPAAATSRRRPGCPARERGPPT